MRKPALFLAALATLPFLAATGTAQKKNRPSKPTQDSVVITFKDGHSQSFPLAEVDRIEFATANSDAAKTSPGHFLGRWKVGDGMGGTFIITLKRDGQASKTFGSSHGTWVVVGDEARISWEDGWKDVIRKAGNHFEKVAYRPGRAFSDDPDHIAEASSMDPI